jgi:hypothetical protein
MAELIKAKHLAAGFKSNIAAKQKATNMVMPFWIFVN